MKSLLFFRQVVCCFWRRVTWNFLCFFVGYKLPVTERQAVVLGSLGRFVLRHCTMNLFSNASFLTPLSQCVCSPATLFPLKKKYIYIFKRFYLFILEGREGREGEREGKKDRSVASLMPPIGVLTHNPGLCPDWESNRPPFSWQASTQPAEPHQPGHVSYTYI